MSGHGLVAGILLMSLYWLGRALSVWIAPFVNSSSSINSTLCALKHIDAARDVQRWLHVSALATASAVSLYMFSVM
jgi:hypothetical protein